VVNGEMSLRRLKLSIYEVVAPREEEENEANHRMYGSLHSLSHASSRHGV
jgi:hypothetical protein